MKKILSLLICSAVMLSLFTVNAVASEEDTAIASGDYSYILNGSEAQIIKYTGNETKVKVPETIDGHKVTKVGFDLANITSYHSSRDDDDYDTYESTIGKYGFAKKDVVSVTIPDSVKEIGAGCFYKCTKLKKVTLSKNLTFIPQEAFYGCESLFNINLPDKVKEICDGSFNKTNIESLKLPKNLSYLNIDSLYKTPLKKITVASGNKTYSAKGGVLYNKKKTILEYYPRYKETKSFTIPKSVRRIRVNAVFRTKYLEKLIVSKNVRTIETNAFEQNKKLTTITFKNSKALKIDEECFYNCKKLSKVNFSSKAKTTICMNAFADCKKLKKIYLPKKVKIKDYGLGYTLAEYDTYLEDYFALEIKGFTIEGKKNSPAHKYAKKNKFKFIAV